MKNMKTFYESQITSNLKEITQFPKRQKVFKSREQKFLTEIYASIVIYASIEKGYPKHFLEETSVDTIISYTLFIRTIL